MSEFDYQRYLASREWAERKEAVRKRSSGYCERCHVREHQQTHHLTYANLGHEPLEDLLGICRPCHEYLSAKRDDDPAEDITLVVIPIPGEAWRADDPAPYSRALDRSFEVGSRISPAALKRAM